MRMSPLEDWIRKRIGASSPALHRTTLEGYQLQRLQHVISYVKQNSSFYREFFQPYPDQPASLSALSEYPITSQEDVRQNPQAFLCIPQSQVQRIVTFPTSGTSGQAKRIFFSNCDLELTIDFFHVGMSTLSRAGDRVMVLFPGEKPDSLGALLRTGLERLGCRVISHGPAVDEIETLKQMRDEDVNVIAGPPIQIYRLAKIDEIRRITQGKQIRSVLPSSDYFAQSARSQIERIWGCEVFDHYGMTETGLGGGVECEAHHGYHLREADLIVEIVDPSSGRPVEEEGFGEVLITTLTRDAMPLIRYRTGDISRLIPEPVCACGSIVQRLDRIQRRKSSGIPFSSGEFHLSDLDEMILGIENVLDFHCKYSKEGGKNILEISYQTVSGDFESTREMIRQSVLEHDLLRHEIDSEQLSIQIIHQDEVIKPSIDYRYKRTIEFL